MAEYYKSSNKFSPIAILIFLLLSITIFPLLAFVYSLAVWYIPIIYINFIITIAIAVITAIVVNKILIPYGKLRSVPLAIMFGALSGMVVIYLAWVVHIDLQINISDVIGNQRMGVAVSTVDIRQALHFASHPAETFDIIGILYEYGSWSLFGINMSGFPLAAVWIIELGIVTILSAFAAIEPASRPYCEDSKDWFKKSIRGPFKPILNRPEFVQRVENGDHTSFDIFELTKNDQSDHILLYLYSNGSGKHYLTAEMHRARLTKDGVEWDISDFLKNIQINDRLKQKLLEISEGHEVKGLENNWMDKIFSKLGRLKG